MMMEVRALDLVPISGCNLCVQLMDCDLHRIIQSKQALTDQHFKCFTKQMLEGIKAMHSVGVFRTFLSYSYCSIDSMMLL